MMKKNIVLYLTILIIFTAAVFNLSGGKVQESITYFPIDPKVSFQTAYTSITLLNQAKNGHYTLEWQLASTLDRKAYLRQDIGLLFSNGKLIDKSGYWKENTKYLKQEKKITNEGSSFFQAITFHHAELHENDNQIFSAQTMSADQLYVIDTPFSPLNSFRTPMSQDEKDWKEGLDQKTNKLLQNSWNKGIQNFSVNLSQYRTIPLTKFYFKSNDSIPGFSAEESKRVVGNLWEGLYKNYFLGIKKANGTTETPIGSTIPLILLAKDKTHLLVLIETASGKPIILRQKMEYAH